MEVVYLRVLLMLLNGWNLLVPMASAYTHLSAISNRDENDSNSVLRSGIPKDRISAEKKLIQELLENYDRVGKNGRPVINTTTAVNVKFGLGLIQMELDEKNKRLEMSTWTRYTWKDEYLVWNPREFDNITQIRLNPELVWIPDIMLYNTADVDIASRHAMVVISHRGRVDWYPHTLFRSSCSVDVTNFPFDEQQCHMWFGSWTYNSREINLTMAFPGGIDFSSFQEDYRESCAWNIVNVTSQRRIMPNEEESPNFIVLAFDISMSRKLVFSSYILTLPCVFLACLTLVVFWLPPERPDRTSLAMSIFSSFMMLLLILVEAALPTASSIPTLGVYYCFNMVLIMFSVILSSMVVNVSRGCSGGRKAPRWVRLLVGRGLATLVLLRGRAPHTPKSQNEVNSESQMMLERIGCAPVRGENGSCRDIYKTNRHIYSNTDDNNKCTDSLEQLRVFGEDLRDLRRSMTRIETKVDEDYHVRGEKLQIVQEWKFLGLVLDRFFFCLYLLLIIISLSALFPRTF